MCGDGRSLQFAPVVEPSVLAARVPHFLPFESVPPMSSVTPQNPSNKSFSAHTLASVILSCLQPRALVRILSRAHGDSRVKVQEPLRALSAPRSVPLSSCSQLSLPPCSSPVLSHLMHPSTRPGSGVTSAQPLQPACPLHGG